MLPLSSARDCLARRKRRGIGLNAPPARVRLRDCSVARLAAGIGYLVWAVREIDGQGGTATMSISPRTRRISIAGFVLFKVV